MTNRIDTVSCEASIIAFIRSKAKMGNLSPDDETLRTIGLFTDGILDSVEFLNLVMFLEERFHCKLMDVELTRENMDTVEGMAKLVARCAG